MNTWIKIRLKKLGKKQNALARELGVDHPRITEMIKGKRKLQTKELPIFAEFLEMPVPDVLASFAGESIPVGDRKVPVVGYVGAGTEIFTYDDHEKGAGYDYVDLPPGVTNSPVAVKVRGDSMLPVYGEDDVLYYDTQAADPMTLINKRCIVRTADGRTFVKTLKQGTEPGLFTLDSFNASPIENIAIEWVARVIWTKHAA